MVPVRLSEPPRAHYYLERIERLPDHWWMRSLFAPGRGVAGEVAGVVASLYKVRYKVEKMGDTLDKGEQNRDNKLEYVI